MIARIAGALIGQNCIKCNSICKINVNKSIVYILYIMNSVV